jgi:hypothetical protein
MKAEIIFPLIYMICLLVLVGPRFLDMNSNFRQFLSNLSIWAIIVLAIATGYQGYFYFLGR